MNEREAAELISRSLVEPIDQEMARQLSDHLVSSEASRRFLELSREIEKVVAGGSETSQQDLSEPCDGQPGLSQVARARIAAKLNSELTRGQQSAADQALAAEDTDNYEIRKPPD